MIHKKYIPCIECGKKANWKYMPGDEIYCDKHVPRGCSCNRELKPEFEYLEMDYQKYKDDPLFQDPNSYFEPLDEKGLRYPCCEYWEIRDNEHDDEEFVRIGWETYYKYNPEDEEE